MATISKEDRPGPRTWRSSLLSHLALSAKMAKNKRQADSRNIEVCLSFLLSVYLIYYPPSCCVSESDWLRDTAYGWLRDFPSIPYRIMLCLAFSLFITHETALLLRSAKSGWIFCLALLQAFLFICIPLLTPRYPRLVLRAQEIHYTVVRALCETVSRALGPSTLMNGENLSPISIH